MTISGFEIPERSIRVASFNVSLLLNPMTDGVKKRYKDARTLALEYSHKYLSKWAPLIDPFPMRNRTYAKVALEILKRARVKAKAAA